MHYQFIFATLPKLKYLELFENCQWGEKIILTCIHYIILSFAYICDIFLILASFIERKVLLLSKQKWLWKFTKQFEFNVKRIRPLGDFFTYVKADFLMVLLSLLSALAKH